MTFRASLHQANLIEAKEKIEKILGDDYSDFDDVELSRNLFRLPIDRENKNFKLAHLQAMNTQLSKIIDSKGEYFKEKILYEEFSKSITNFDILTGFIGMTGGTRDTNFIYAQNLYLDAISTYKKYVTPYQNNLEFLYIPIKLRLAIENHFKNTICYEYAEKTLISGSKKGQVSKYILNISSLLNFFSSEKYSKYFMSPVDISIIKDINSWSNNFIHTGIASFSWQSLTAIDLLKPLFYTKREDGSRHIEGFNYVNLNLSQEELNKDLNYFLSTKKYTVKVFTTKRLKKPIEGGYYDNSYIF